MTAKNSLIKKNKRLESTEQDLYLHDPSWYKDAVIYQVHVKSYFDSNNDGVGDFSGLIAKLDYIAELGVNAIWLLPFYPSPMRDDGYDIADYRAVEPSYGTMAEARQFIHEAHKRGLRVITELVINHTSDQHPWFQKARYAKRGSKARNFYVWSDTNQKYEGTRIIFSDTESSNWTWDPVAEQYFWHRFYSNQPDLNFDNPEVLKEVLAIMRFWFDLGVDGLRLDAIPYLVEREGTANENLPETHAVLKKIRAELDTHYPDRMLLAEANLWPEDIQQYFGDGDECHMAFHFPLMPRMYMAIAQEDRFPIIDILRQMPDIPERCQWAIFLRNHDELTLEMVTDQERDYLWNHYANDKRARLNLGIRRRLAPLVERDRRRIELLKSLLLSMPGTPTLYYGDEIGMGDNIFLGDRHGVRTPMQWTNDRNGGFSRADPASLTLPLIMDPLYGFQAINVEAQARDAHSLLNWTRRMLSVRKQHKAFGRGSLKILFPSNRRILTYVREYNAEGAGEVILCVANMSRAAQAAELDLTAYVGKVPIEMIGGTLFPPIGHLNYQLTLPPYGFYWFLLVDESQMRSWTAPPAEVVPELPTIVIKQGLLEIFSPPAKNLLEQECVPVFLQNRAWCQYRSGSAADINLAFPCHIGQERDGFVIAQLGIKGAGYHLALGLVAEHQASSLTKQLTLARLRQKRAASLLVDAFSIPEFSRQLVQFFYQPPQDCNTGFQCRVTWELPPLTGSQMEDIQMVFYQHSLLVVVGASVVIKPVRRIVAGSYPFVELSDHLRQRGFLNLVKVLGQVQRMLPEGQGEATVALLQEYLADQADAWQWTQNTLERGFRDHTTSGNSSMNDQVPALVALEDFSRTMGLRLGQMHCLLAQSEGAPGFASLPADANHLTEWTARILSAALDLVQWLEQHPQEDLRNSASRIATQLPGLEQHFKENLGLLESSPLIRIHGNLHLGQVLVVAGDAFFGDFDEPPLGVLESARVLASPFKDVAGMLLSFDDAAAAAVRHISDADPLADTGQASAFTVLYRHRAKTAFYKAYQQATESLRGIWAQPEQVALALQFASVENRIYRALRASVNTGSLQYCLRELEDKLAQIGANASPAQGSDSTL